MSYPRNAASPERVDIGAVIQISDGAVQTSGVAVKVIPQGASEASGGGTIGYSADGVVHYLPTQAETNYTSFILIASKSGCIPASKTVVTSANNTAGKVTVQTNDDKNGYALTQSFPANFAALGINASGHVSRVTLVDTCTTNSDMRGTDNAALAATALSTAVWTTTIAGRIDVAVSTRLAPLVAGRDIAVAATTGAVALDSATQTKINKIEAAVAGTVTGAGTSTEVFAGPSATLTITVDSSGNRSNVEVT